MENLLGFFTPVGGGRSHDGCRSFGFQDTGVSQYAKHNALYPSVLTELLAHEHCADKTRKKRLFVSRFFDWTNIYHCAVTVWFSIQ